MPLISRPWPGDPSPLLRKQLRERSSAQRQSRHSLDSRESTQHNTSRPAAGSSKRPPASFATDLLLPAEGRSGMVRGRRPSGRRRALSPPRPKRRGRWALQFAEVGDTEAGSSPQFLRTRPHLAHLSSFLPPQFSKSGNLRRCSAPPPRRRGCPRWCCSPRSRSSRSTCSCHRFRTSRRSSRPTTRS